MSGGAPSQGALQADEDLWAEFVSGRGCDGGVGQAAFGTLIQRHREPLYWYLLLSTGKQDAAVMHCRDTWALLAAWRRPLEGFRSFRSCLYGVATQNFVPATHPPAFGVADFLDDLKRPDHTSRRAKLFFHITELVPAERQPFLLVTIAGLSVPDAANACRFTPERTRRSLARAYDRLARTDLFKRAEA